MATKLELNHLKKNRINSIDKEIVKVIDFESISKEFLNDRIEMLLQNDNNKQIKPKQNFVSPK